MVPPARAGQLVCLLLGAAGDLVRAGERAPDPLLLQALAPSTCPTTPPGLNLAQRHAKALLKPTAAQAVVDFRGFPELVGTAAEAHSTWRRHPRGQPSNRSAPHAAAAGLAWENLPRRDSAEKGEIAVPLAALALGGAMGLAGWSSAGLVAGYFGAQSGLSLYMKLVLSDAAISRELGMRGLPAAFLISGVQQVVAWLAMGSFFLCSWVAGWRWVPKRVATKQNVATVLCLSLAFAGNIGLNNFSLSLMAISLNLVLRSCMPLVTLVAHAFVGLFQPDAFPKVTSSETALILIGVACAGLVTVSELQASKNAVESEHLLLGVLFCVISICSGAMDLVLGKVLGKQMGLSAPETTWYMSLPAALALFPPALLVPHPTEWPNLPRATDWEVILKVIELRPAALLLVLLSGVFSVSYNVLRYTMVQQLSASHTAFAGNFNKAMTILMSLVLGLEPVPEGIWGSIMLLSIVGSISAFMVYSFLTTSADVKPYEPHKAPKPWTTSGKGALSPIQEEVSPVSPAP